MAKSFPHQPKAGSGIPRVETPGTNTKEPKRTGHTDLQMITTKKRWVETPVADISPPTKSPCRLILDSPTREVHLVATEVKKEVREHGADLLKQIAHKLVGAVKDGVDGSVCPRRILAQITGSQETWSTWITTQDSEEGLNAAVWPHVAPQTLLSTALPRFFPLSFSPHCLFGEIPTGNHTLSKDNTGADPTLTLQRRRAATVSAVTTRTGCSPGQDTAFGGRRRREQEKAMFSWSFLRFQAQTQVEMQTLSL